MSKTPEEKAALEKFHEAVEEYVRSSGGEGLVIDWMLVTAEHLVEEDGSATALATYVSREQSIYRTAGLVNYARIKIDNTIARRRSPE